MKVRTGFISNSSSSSFVVIFMKGELTRENFLNLLNINSNSILNNPIGDMFDYIKLCEYMDLVEDEKSLNEFLKDFGYEYAIGDPVPKKYEELFLKGYSFIRVSLSYNEDITEMMYNEFLKMIANENDLLCIKDDKDLIILSEEY